ncbi:hypothetical protein C9374_002616 [Naegleria lovaniensis]|uniref:Pseudouridine synthase I TruA alpha/beta domain-containing protein n=1 Tax=Naegleria lovaniensis TaxID=51637 RepID=A0AA88KJY9_NAELO|nr:uncharacterized protein C9374_002616 [Naegleria lovaniensis]KAG2386170.1 hypothetical protein C9374_002616 [Naegleria lovaniensis]
MTQVFNKVIMKQQQMTNFGNNERLKRLLMCVGYSGNGVSGSQFQRNVSVEKTIEGKLLKHMHQVGMLGVKQLTRQQENDYGKKQEFYTKLHTNMDWNASSRTDKGVHAVANFFSCNIPPTAPNIKAKLSEWRSELNNSFASDDILQVFHMDVLEDNEEFNCRQFGMWRTYEYFIPQFCLKAMYEVCRSIPNTNQSNSQKKGRAQLPEINLEQICTRFNSVFSKMEGFRNFQNFTSASSAQSNHSNKVEDEEDQDDELFQDLTLSDSVGRQFYRTVLQCQAKSHTLPIPHFKLYSSSTTPLSTAETLRGISIKVTASGFLYHQIRKMIGLAISHWLYPKEIDEEFIDISLFSQERMFIPTAPGDSLILVHTALKDPSLEKFVYNNSGNMRPETHSLYPQIMLETSASFKHVQNYLSTRSNSGDKKQDEKKPVQRSSWIQLAHELKFYLNDLVNQKENVKKRAKKQIEAQRKREEWKKRDEQEQRAAKISSISEKAKQGLEHDVDFLPIGYRLHFYVKFKCLPNEERTISALNTLQEMIRLGTIPPKENNFEILDQIVLSKFKHSFPAL